MHREWKARRTISSRRAGCWFLLIECESIIVFYQPKLHDVMLETISTIWLELIGRYLSGEHSCIAYAVYPHVIYQEYEILSESDWRTTSIMSNTIQWNTFLYMIRQISRLNGGMTVRQSVASAHGFRRHMPHGTNIKIWCLEYAISNAYNVPTAMSMCIYQFLI